MLASSSTSASRLILGKADVIRLLKKALWFACPIVVVFAVIAWSLWRTGELRTIESIVHEQTTAGSLLYGAEYSDRNFQYKVQTASALGPDLLAIGASRVNQWQAWMFAPYRFYNGGNSAYSQSDYLRFLNALPNPAPRVILFSIDAYTFTENWDANFRHYTYVDGLSLGSELQRTVIKKLLRRFAKRPSDLLLPSSRNGVPVVGLNAMTLNAGFRNDGSMQYGNRPMVWDKSLADALRRVERGEAPFQFGSDLDEARRQQLEEFAAAAKARGIILVGVTMPYSPDVITALLRSSKHEIWRRFRSKETAEWIKAQGIIYFDFTEVTKFDGRPNEFIDPFHATETAYARILLKMLDRGDFRSLFPAIDREVLRLALPAPGGRP